ncbi:MAG TPA: peptidylprolyl isomerase [Puia sp.]|nr:peptidylprolyl isomerase [Puia sp.]
MSSPVRRLFLIHLATLLLLFGFFSVPAQSLFTLDGSGISKEEFLKAYNKNNNGSKASDKSYRDYLELYVRYKLKVRAAYDTQLDTLAGQRSELQNFRSQVAETYLKDEISLDRLVKEVFTRGQHDIHISHIFIALPKNPSVTDTLRAYEKAMAAYNDLKRGKKFGETALAYSEDPSVKTNQGNLGYITVFTLPYVLETLAYTTPAGKFSMPYRSKGGYHIFKNEGERKALGRIKVAQILLSFPPGATEAARFAVHKRADSIYALLQKGADFASLAKTNSGDNLSYQMGGELPEFGIGSYDSAFEATAFGLDREGAFSKPIPSSYGYHIIKLIARKPFPHQMDEEAGNTLKQQIQNDPRIEISRKALFTKIYQQTGMQRAEVSERDLWAFTDSTVRNIGLTSYGSLNFSTVLLSFSRRSYTVKEWLDYVRSAARGQRFGGAQVDKDQFERWVDRVSLEYYRNHLEEYNKDFAFQLTEFKEGNLLFEIMQRKIWDKASTDSTGLRNYYEAHKNKYWWESSADALLFTSPSQQSAEGLKEKLQSHGVYSWRSWTDSAGVGAQADSGRYELAQIPGATGGAGSAAAVGAGSFTPFVTNKADNTVSFAYILNVYRERSPRNYRDARGFVINDYQTWLEDQWIAALKKKYPVKVDETVLASLPK